MLLILQEAAIKTAEPIGPGGWIFMAVSVGFVTVLMVWCFTKVLSLPPEEEKREEETLEHFHTA